MFGLYHVPRHNQNLASGELRAEPLSTSWYFIFTLKPSYKGNGTYRYLWSSAIVKLGKALLLPLRHLAVPRCAASARQEEAQRSLFQGKGLN